MDGGRVLRALLASRLGYVRATEIAAMIGQGVAFVLGFLGLFGNPLLIFIAIFVYLAGFRRKRISWRPAPCRAACPVTAAMVTQFATLTPGRACRCCGRDFTAHQSRRVPGGGRPGQPLGVLEAQRSHPRLKERGPDARVADAMTVSIPTVNKNRCLDEAFRLLQEKSAPAVGRGRHGRPVGRADNVRDHRRDADAASGAADRRALRAMGPVRPQRGLR